MSTGSKTWILNEPFFVKANSTDTDGKPNWAYDRTDPGAVAVLGIESSPDGTGGEVGDRTIPAGDSFTVYVVGRDEFGNFVGNIAPDAWSLINVTGLVDPLVPGDLVVAPDGRSATFTGRGVGACQIEATIAGLDTNVTGTVTVVPGPLDHFGFATISSPRTAGTAFAITATAYDAYNNVKTDYVGSAALSVTGNTISPTTTGAFTAGVRSGLNVTIQSAQTGAAITATDGAATGTSNAFNVNAPTPTQFIATTTGGTDSGSSVSANIPAGTANNDLLIALVESYQASGTPGQPSTVPSGWTLLATRTVDRCNFSVYYRVASGDTPGASRTWGYGSSRQIGINIATYRGGFSTSSPVDVHSNTAYTTANLTLRAASLTTSGPNRNLIFVGGAWLSTTSRTATVPSGFTEDVENAPFSPYFLRYFAHATTPQAVAGASGDKDATMSGSGTVTLKHAFLIALNP